MWFFQHKDELRELQRRVDDLERNMKALDLDWSSTYDKFRSILARMAKRAERASQEEALPTAGFQEESTAPGDSSSLPQLLTPRQMAAQAKILARRRSIARVTEQ